MPKISDPIAWAKEKLFGSNKQTEPDKGLYTIYESEEEAAAGELPDSTWSIKNLLVLTFNEHVENNSKFITSVQDKFGIAQTEESNTEIEKLYESLQFFARKHGKDGKLEVEDFDKNPTLGEKIMAAFWTILSKFSSKVKANETTVGAHKSFNAFVKAKAEAETKAKEQAISTE